MFERRNNTFLHLEINEMNIEMLNSSFALSHNCHVSCSLVSQFKYFGYFSYILLSLLLLFNYLIKMTFLRSNVYL